MQWRDISVFLLAVASACSVHTSHGSDSHGAGGSSGAAQPGDSQDGSVAGGGAGAGAGASAGAAATSGGGGTSGLGGNDGGANDSSALPAPSLSHTFDPIAIASGSEITTLCQSWTLNNDSPIWVNQVVESNQGYFHHSNWIWVPDTYYTGADGNWNCTDRGFDQVSAGAVGGVFFAQSTQSKTDTQAFEPGVAFEMPAHARIIGNVHLLNASAADATTSMKFDVYSIQRADLQVSLQPMAFTNVSLNIAPNGTTDARMSCAVPQPDFGVYYVLPHFHILGQVLLLDVVGGPMDGTNVFRSQGTFGEPQGRSFDPPLRITGATALRVTCEYENPRGVSVAYGEADQEMCVVLLYTDGLKAGGTTIGNSNVTDAGGVRTTDAICAAVSWPATDQ
jgi:hypothetical protein